MRCHPLAARRLLVIAPHPDDEAIGAWGLMRRRRVGASVRVIVVSDGAASHPGSLRWPPERLATERRRETRRAMATLGLAPSAVRFLGLPDGVLDMARVEEALRQAMRRCPAPDLIVGPLATDAHADHRAVARAISRLPRRGERRIGYQVWPAVAARRRGPCVSLGMAGTRMKRRVIHGYRTQTGRITDAVAGFTITPAHLRAFAAPLEQFEILA